MNEPQGYTQALVDILNSKLAQDIMAAYDQGAKDTEDAIIKLLEADKIERQPICKGGDCEKCSAFERGFDRAIALIKGENK